MYNPGDSSLAVQTEKVEEEGREGRGAAKAAGTIFCSQHVTAKQQPDLGTLVLPSLPLNLRVPSASKYPKTTSELLCRLQKKQESKHQVQLKATDLKRRKLNRPGRGGNAITAKKINVFHH